MGNYRHHGYPYQLTSFFWGEDRGVLTLLNREWPEAGEFLMLQACNLSDCVLNHPRFKPGKVSTDISPKSGSIVFFRNVHQHLDTVADKRTTVSPGRTRPNMGPDLLIQCGRHNSSGFVSFDFQDEHFQKVFHAFFNHIWVSK